MTTIAQSFQTRAMARAEHYIAREKQSVSDCLLAGVLDALDTTEVKETWYSDGATGDRKKVKGVLEGVHVDDCLVFADGSALHVFADRLEAVACVNTRVEQ
ncbi:MAG: hypothetical protein WAX89_02630 [Alphaproteobacteria bacterium]